MNRIQIALLCFVLTNSNALFAQQVPSNVAVYRLKEINQSVVGKNIPGLFCGKYFLLAGPTLENPSRRPLGIYFEYVAFGSSNSQGIAIVGQEKIEIVLDQNKSVPTVEYAEPQGIGFFSVVKMTIRLSEKDLKDASPCLTAPSQHPPQKENPTAQNATTVRI